MSKGNTLLVTLDSNVWEKMICPFEEHFQTDPLIKTYEQLHGFLRYNFAEFYLSATIFSLESIRRNYRRPFFSEYESDIDFTEIIEKESGEVQLTFTVKPNDIVFPEMGSYLKKYVKIALKNGFKLIQVPRIGMPMPCELKEHICNDTEQQLNLKFEVLQYIEQELEAGFNWLSKLFIECNLPDSLTSMENLPDGIDKKVSKIIAEWADADSIAAHIGHGCHYFCTNDRGAGAGRNSEMHPDNIAKLDKKYGLKVVNAEELLALLRTASPRQK